MHLTWLTLWGSLVLVLHNIFHDTFWISIPWLPISVIGTAVAFYVGFKNNSAYDRLWEARKIWGGIVNTSRMWARFQRAMSETLSEKRMRQIQFFMKKRER